MHLYIVDDAAPIRRKIASQLTARAGVRVVGEAASAAEAVRGIMEARPDVVTLDLHLAAGHGLDVLAATRLLTPSPTVVVITNHAEPQVRSRCIAAGARDVFDKSFEFQDAMELCQRLASLFDHHQRGLCT